MEAPPVVDNIELILSRCFLPQNLKQRLRDDSQDPLYQRIDSVMQLKAELPNSSYCGWSCGCWCCKDTTLVEEGRIGILKDDGQFSLLAPGYHSFSTFGTELLRDCDIGVVNVAVTYGAAGFVTVTEGFIGVLHAGPAFRLLAPGTYQWDSPSVQFMAAVDISVNAAKLGPYTLVTVPEGDVAVTYNNGMLRVLGNPATSSAGECRAYFLDDPKWELAGMLSLQTQTDRLDSNDLLSKDNVELVMVAMSQWRISDPVLAVTNCAASMRDIRTKVNQLVRATIARIVAGTCIGAGPVSGVASRPVIAAVAMDVSDPGKAAAAAPEEAGLARLMQSEQATHHMAELSASMIEMGIEVISVYVPEKRMKNDDVRQQVAKQAVIGIKADAERSSADARAYATVKAAVAEAEAVALLARAHAEAGANLGDPSSTAARLALTEATSRSLKDAKLTIFSGAPNSLPFLLNADTTK